MLNVHEVAPAQLAAPFVSNVNQLPPAIVALVTWSGAWFVVTVLETVMEPFAGPVVEPFATTPKSRSVTAITALPPVPVSDTVVGGPGALLTIVRVAFRAPAAAGVKVTKNVALSPVSSGFELRRPW